MKRLFALVGKNISYSFSRAYFAEKFKKEHISDAEYVNFDLNCIGELPQKLQENPNIQGMNVTIPYKKEIISMLAKLDPISEQIGAVNTIKITKKGLVGYNTDHFGFSESLKPFLEQQHTKALILGTGGASNAVAYALKMLGISFRFVSRNPKMGQFSYADLSPQIIGKYKIIINCTPLGTFPNVEDFPPIPYQFLTSEHLLYDLIYNPEKTIFLQKGEKKNATIINGRKMLELQAEKAWEIWNTNPDED
ncbi:shikimate dehydrogenase family protein [Capnocytophaga felis]|uniref:Shikimate 5-dehydrogenase n=1 Tax=Capnocytophaga felis TaxID=2267611 RepID=A0A5M4BBD9_9FLAO|nr:shikimate dehydrogenase [Capnocytophaga felis]GET46750.1 shikimate 5-dehydrogenase [Capnocytophaga felis]GET48450.1 shikimate 5-dehydrogenase [Capnocytophaga felis]